MKHVLITGGSSGIGYAIAQEFAKENVKITLVARNKKKLEEARESLGTNVDILPADLTTSDIEKCVSILKDVDILVNNAGFGKRGRFDSIDLLVQHNMMGLNMSAPVRLTHHALQNGAERIINIASVAAFQPGPYMAVYYATKSFLYSWSRALQAENEDVEITTVCPGPTKTAFESRAGIQFDWHDTPKLVAKKAVAGSGLVVIGWRNKFMRWLSWILPDSVVIKMVASMQRRNL